MLYLSQYIKHIIEIVFVNLKWYRPYELNFSLQCSHWFQFSYLCDIYQKATCQHTSHTHFLRCLQSIVRPHLHMIGLSYNWHDLSVKLHYFALLNTRQTVFKVISGVTLTLSFSGVSTTSVVWFSRNNESASKVYDIGADHK
jgi:hypothetical protein